MSWSLAIRGKTPPSKNSLKGAHWAQLQSLHDEWENEVTDLLTYGDWQPDDVPDVPVSITVQIYETDRRKRDVLNYADHALHGVIDGLVKGEVLPEDNAYVIPSVTLEYHVVPEAPSPATRLVLEHYPEEVEADGDGT